MDRDVFTRCTRLGRQVAAGVVDALEGRPWSEFLPSKLLDDLIQQAGGIPSARSVLGLVRKHDRSPYLPELAADAGQQELDEILRREGVGALDAVLVDAAKRLLPGKPGARQVLEEFLFTVLSRHSFEGRGGSILETRGASWYNARVSEIRRLMRPVIERAACVLEERPDARVLGLARSERLSPDEDLRGMVVQ